MKNKKELNLIKFFDLSSSEEWRLRLLANLLLETNGNLEAPLIRELGNEIIRFLEFKIVLEHVFLKRTVPTSVMPREQLNKEAKNLEIKMNC